MKKNKKIGLIVLFSSFTFLTSIGVFLYIKNINNQNTTINNIVLPFEEKPIENPEPHIPSDSISKISEKEKNADFIDDKKQKNKFDNSNSNNNNNNNSEKNKNNENQEQIKKSENQNTNQQNNDLKKSSNTNNNNNNNLQDKSKENIIKQLNENIEKIVLGSKVKRWASGISRRLNSASNKEEELNSIIEVQNLNKNFILKLVPFSNSNFVNNINDQLGTAIIKIKLEKEGIYSSTRNINILNLFSKDSSILTADQFEISANAKNIFLANSYSIKSFDQLVSEGAISLKENFKDIAAPAKIIVNSLSGTRFYSLGVYHFTFAIAFNGDSSDANNTLDLTGKDSPSSLILPGFKNKIEKYFNGEIESEDMDVFPLQEGYIWLFHKELEDLRNEIINSDSEKLGTLFTTPKRDRNFRSTKKNKGSIREKIFALSKLVNGNMGNNFLYIEKIGEPTKISNNSFSFTGYLIANGGPGQRIRTGELITFKFKTN